MTSYAFRQGKATGGQHSPERSGACCKPSRTHGDAVRDIAFHVEDADARSRGGRAAPELDAAAERTDANGTIRRAAIQTYGDTIHSFISYQGLPRAVPSRLSTRRAPARSGHLRIDHIVGNVELGKMNEWADW